jgi:hypothetical protein
MGYTTLPNVVLNGELEAFLDVLSNMIPFDIVVTSGIRTPEKQAAAMFQKIDLGDDLLAIYKDDTFAQAIINAHPNLQQATEIVERYAAAGGGSSHLRGQGVDLRTRDKTPEQIEQMKRAVEALGEFALVETTPPHLHITIKKKYRETSLTGPKAWFLVGSLGLIGLYTIWKK